jgi:hypothetical protein
MTDKKTGRAGGSLQARRGDELRGSISSEITAKKAKYENPAEWMDDPPWVKKATAMADDDEDRDARHDVDEPIGLDDQGNLKDVPPDTDPSVRTEWFMWRASEAAQGARVDNLAGLKITPEMLQAAEDVIKAWTEARDIIRDQVQP